MSSSFAFLISQPNIVEERKVENIVPVLVFHNHIAKLSLSNTEFNSKYPGRVERLCKTFRFVLGSHFSRGRRELWEEKNATQWKHIEKAFLFKTKGKRKRGRERNVRIQNFLSSNASEVSKRAFCFFCQTRILSWKSLWTFSSWDIFLLNKYESLLKLVQKYYIKQHLYSSSFYIRSLIRFTLFSLRSFFLLSSFSSCLNGT